MCSSDLALTEMFKPRKKIYAKVNYADIAGLDGSAGKSGISGELLNKLAQMDGFILVARAFENDQVVHPAGSVDPERDIRTMEGEFILNDLVACEKKLERLSDECRKGGGRDKALIDREIELFGRLRGTLEEEKPLRGLTLTADEEKTISGYGLLSRKPVLILVNLDETQPVPVISYRQDQTRIDFFSAKIEMELAQK